MSVCTFFGHRFVPPKTEPILRSTLIEIIKNRGVNLFYVGNQGNYDAMVRRVLENLSNEYRIKYYVVLAYMPGKKGLYVSEDSDTILPEGIETVPCRFAINYRNTWMIERSDYVITYVTHEIGSGAAHFKSLAQKKGKQVLELSGGHNCSNEADYQ